MSALVLAYLAGLLTIVNPCVLPLAPIVFASARAQNPWGPVALAAGLALTFGIVGGLLASAGIELGETGVIRTLAGAIMVAFGVILLVPALAHALENLMAPLAGFSARFSQAGPTAGLVGQAGAGALLAFAWAPCVGPTIGAALALAATGGSLPRAMATMMIFALGAATSLLIAGYGLGHLARKGRVVAGQSAKLGRILLGLTFVIVGGGIVTGFDKTMEAGIASIMPDWLVHFATLL